MIYEFPLSFMFDRDFPGVIGERMQSVSHLCLQPPFPWGTWRTLNILDRLLPQLSGEFAEFGVAMGGMSLLLGMLGEDHGRRVFACDSFRGLPAPDPLHDNPYFERGFYEAAPGSLPLLERFTREISDRNLGDTVQIVAGFFDDIQEHELPESIAFAHVDADLYGSVTQALRLTWPRLSQGGVLVIDDFFHPAQGPAQACRDFFTRVGETVVYHVLFPYSVMVCKGVGLGTEAKRAHDGNFYRLNQLEDDELFIARLRTEAEQSHGDSPAAVLLRALEGGHCDIYTYWYALREYWSAIDVPLDEIGVPLQL